MALLFGQFIYYFLAKKNLSNRDVFFSKAKIHFYLKTNYAQKHSLQNTNSITNIYILTFNRFNKVWFYFGYILLVY